MEPYVFAAVLAAAAMHAGWNSFVKVSLEPLLAMTLISAMGGLAAVPLLIWFGWPKADAWPWLIGSVVVQVCAVDPNAFVPVLVPLSMLRIPA